MSSTPPEAELSTRKIYMMPHGFPDILVHAALDVAEKEPIDDDNPWLRIR